MLAASSRPSSIGGLPGNLPCFSGATFAKAAKMSSLVSGPFRPGAQRGRCASCAALPARIFSGFLARIPRVGKGKSVLRLDSPAAFPYNRECGSWQWWPPSGKAPIALLSCWPLLSAAQKREPFALSAGNPLKPPARPADNGRRQQERQTWHSCFGKPRRRALDKGFASSLRSGRLDTGRGSLPDAMRRFQRCRSNTINGKLSPSESIPG